MVTGKKFPRALAVLALLIYGGFTSVIEAAEFRGTVSRIEPSGQLRINLPGGVVVRPGDEVRLETVIPGVGAVEIKSRWRVELVGDGFVIAAPQGRDGATPQVGHIAIVTSAAPAPPAAVAPAATGRAAAADSAVPPVPLSGAHVAELVRRADGGDAQAMFMLGVYHSGRAASSDNVPRSLEEAIRWYEKAAASGDTGAMVSLGFLHQSQRKDDARAAEWFRMAAEKGDAEAMSALSRLYMQGRGVPKDDTQAFEWARKAAQGGNEFMAYELADMHFRGRGTRQDFVEAAHWYRRAADSGFAPAMLQLAQLYANGMGLAKDVSRGFEWALKAAQAGSPFAMYQVGTFYLQGSGVVVSPSEARRWFEQAANAGEAEGMYGLSRIYNDGLGAAANPGLAADWMIRAINSGSFQAVESVMRTPSRWSKAFRVELQKKLREAGIYSGSSDGDIGAGTRRAIEALSRQARLR